MEQGKLRIQLFKNEFGLYDKWTYMGDRLLKTEMSYPKLTNVSKLQKPVDMSKKQELFEQMSRLFRTFEEQHNGTTKRSQANARKAVGEFKKLVTGYRKESVAASK